MYEGFFSLSKRPFSSVPSADSFVGLESIQDALDSLLICVTQSHGVAVVTSAAGLGKTMLCKKLAEVAASRFQSIYLSTSAFSTRRALLQAVLYEFGIQYEGVTEQESRLKIMEAARAIAKEKRTLLIIVDEAHLLNSRLFEELRTLSDYAPEGEALIRIVLSGQYELDEKLADPSLAAIHQRIGCHVTLEPLSLDESSELILERLRRAGAEEIDQILETDALEAICRASDGNARCLSQLADHSFLLAFAEEQIPVSRDTVLAALDDLKELPLHWNELPSGDSSISSSPDLETASADTDEFEIPESLKQQTEESLILPLRNEEEETTASRLPAVDDEEIEYTVFEVGAELPRHADDESKLTANITEEIEPEILEELPVQPDEHDFTDEIVNDKYAHLDRLAELPESMQQPQAEPDSFSHDDDATELWQGEELDPCDDDSESLSAQEKIVLETINDLRREIGDSVDESRSQITSRQMDHDFGDWLNLDIVQPEVDEDESVPSAESITEHVESILETDSSDATAESDPTSDAPLTSEMESLESPSRFAQLFTRLSQRRRRLRSRNS